jgi:hypothetical protein
MAELCLARNKAELAVKPNPAAERISKNWW